MFAIINSPSADSANMEQADVDRSAERASSAVEVGATNSPDGAAIHRGEPREADAPYGERKPEATLTGAEGFVPPAGTAAEINQSAAHPVEAVADNPQVPRPSAAAPLSNPQPTSSPDADKTGEAATPLPVSPVALSDDDFDPSKLFLNRDRKTEGLTPEMIRRLRPGCAHADDIRQCGGHGKKLCNDCKKAMAASEAEVA